MHFESCVIDFRSSWVGGLVEAGLRGQGQRWRGQDGDSALSESEDRFSKSLHFGDTKQKHWLPKKIKEAINWIRSGLSKILPARHAEDFKFIRVKQTFSQSSLALPSFARAVALSNCARNWKGQLLLAIRSLWAGRLPENFVRHNFASLQLQRFQVLKVHRLSSCQECKVALRIPLSALLQSDKMQEEEADRAELSALKHIEQTAKAYFNTILTSNQFTTYYGVSIPMYTVSGKMER